MKLLLLPFAAIAAFETTIFAFARVAERFVRKRLPKEVLSIERRNALRSRNSPTDLKVDVSNARNQSRPVRSRSAARPDCALNDSTLSHTLTHNSS